MEMVKQWQLLGDLDIHGIAGGSISCVGHQGGMEDQSASQMCLLPMASYPRQVLDVETSGAAWATE
jgi:hypothetical protein